MYNFLPIFRLVTELDQQGKRKLWSYFARLDEADQVNILGLTVKFQNYKKSLSEYPSSVTTLDEYFDKLGGYIFFLFMELTAIEYFRTEKGRELRQTRQYTPTQTEPKRNTMAFRVKTFYSEIHDYRQRGMSWREIARLLKKTHRRAFEKYKRLDPDNLAKVYHQFERELFTHRAGVTDNQNPQTTLPTH